MIGVVTPTLALPQLPMSERSAKERLAGLPPDIRRAWLIDQTPAVIASIERGDWWFERRHKQTAPLGDWLVWVVGSGRGWGKNRVGAETLVEWMETYPRDRAGNRTEWMIVAETLKDVVDLNLEGPSGLVNVLRRLGYRKVRYPPKDGDTTPCFTYVKAPKPTVTLYPNQQVVHCDSADNADVGRGYNLAGLWLDEVAKWGPMSHDAWYDGLLPALRADLPNGGNPRCVVTTTPKPIGLLKEWYTFARAGDPMYRLTIGSTYENAANLNPNTLQILIRTYEGTRKGRQELHGELLDEVEGALWTRDLLDRQRVWTLPPLRRLVLGTDPAGTGTGDEQGLVVIGTDEQDQQFVIADLSKKLAGIAAAKHAWKALLEHRHHLADQHTMPLLIVEEDYGKKWLKDVLEVVFKSMRDAGLFDRHDRPPIDFVKASLLGGKSLRAEPVAMRYEVGRIWHFGVHPGLEDQMATWDPNDKKSPSPDRVDALVHGSLWLKGKEGKRASISSRLDNATLPTTRLTPFG